MASKFKRASNVFLFPFFYRNSSRNMSKVAVIPKGVSQSWKSLSELEKSSLEEQEDLALEEDDEDNDEVEVGNNKFKKVFAKRKRKRYKKGVTFRETVKKIQAGKKIGLEIMASFNLTFHISIHISAFCC